MATTTEPTNANAVISSPTRRESAASLLESRSPATGKKLGEVPVASADEVVRTMARARRAQAAWAMLPPAERAERVLRFRNALVERTDEVVDIVSAETGKPRFEALISEVVPIADLATYFCERAKKLLAPKPIDVHLLKNRRQYVHYTPRGVVAIISPWNFPFTITFGDAIAALLAGNAVVIKPSEVTPLSVQKGKEIWDAAGLPPDLLQIVHGRGDVGGALIDAMPDKVVFTGGVATGKRVAAMCGERLIPCVLELGGKAPLIACEDADIEATARAIVFGGFHNSGQVCVSIERVYAHEKIHDLLLERVVGLVSALRQGDPASDETDVGSMTFPRQVEIVERHIEDAIAKGATVRTGGRRKEAGSMMFAPTVLAGCDHSMTVMKEEIFGAIVPFMKVGSEEEAIALANDSHLGLNAYVFTTDRDRGCRIAERVLAGTVLVNEVLINHAMPESPFGGVKQSGIGRVHGDDCLREMSHARLVNVDRFGPAQNPLWMPYSAKTSEWVKRGLRAMFSGQSVWKRIGELF